jgi:uncharacterized LabA/DUF88 family protein
MKERVACFVDGFNLYHAINDLGCDYYKWVNLRKLLEFFIDRTAHRLVSIFYFSAFASWLPGPYARHQQYVKALRANGVVTVLGRFKTKILNCRKCGCEWSAHEEKESDVNIALWMLDRAYRNEYDRGYLVSSDSDLVPAVKLLRKRFPEKVVKAIAPPERRHGKEIAQVATSLASIKKVHLARSLLPARIYDSSGKLIAVRPYQYAPPE